MRKIYDFEDFNEKYVADFAKHLGLDGSDPYKLIQWKNDDIDLRDASDYSSDIPEIFHLDENIWDETERYACDNDSWDDWADFFTEMINNYIKTIPKNSSQKEVVKNYPEDCELNNNLYDLDDLIDFRDCYVKQAHYKGDKVVEVTLRLTKDVLNSSEN